MNLQIEHPYVGAMMEALPGLAGLKEKLRFSRRAEVPFSLLSKAEMSFLVALYRHGGPEMPRQGAQLAPLQNAMQSAMRDHRLAWGSYELNHALHIALADGGSERAWLAGKDVFAPAVVAETDSGDMAKMFDAIKAQLH